MNTSDQPALAFLAFRLALGVNMLIHGLSRIPNLGKFTAKVVTDFQGTILPTAFVQAFAYSISFVEAAIGLLLVLGLRTGWALFVANLLMTSLIFGTALRQDWNLVGTQLIYVIAFFLAHLHVHQDRYSLDAIFARKSQLNTTP